MARRGSSSFRVHPAVHALLAEFTRLDVARLAGDNGDLAVIASMQDEIREILQGVDPGDRWRAPARVGRDRAHGGLERDCAIANGILLEGWLPSGEATKLDAIKAKVLEDWNRLRTSIGPVPGQPPRLTSAIVTHAWHRCIALARARHGHDVVPHAFSAQNDEHVHVILSEPRYVTAARKRWRHDPVFRRDFPAESACVAYIEAVARGAVEVNGERRTLDQELGAFMI